MNPFISTHNLYPYYHPMHGPIHANYLMGHFPRADFVFFLIFGTTTSFINVVPKCSQMKANDMLVESVF